MNVELELKRICEKNNGEFNHKSFKVDGEIGSFVHISKYNLKITYRNVLMNIVYDFGNSDTAQYLMEIPNLQKPYPFEIKTFDPFTKLVLLKKHSWKIVSSSPSLKKEIETSIIKSNLNILFKNTAFEISTKGTIAKKNYSIATRLSLKYEGKIESVESLISFHKLLIDSLINRYQMK